MAEPRVLINKADKGLYSVQDGLNLKLNRRSLLPAGFGLLSSQTADQAHTLLSGHLFLRGKVRNAAHRGWGGGRSGKPDALAGFQSEGGSPALGLFHPAASSHTSTAIEPAK
jgi:hypothetical protein